MPALERSSFFAFWRSGWRIDKPNAALARQPVLSRLLLAFAQASG
jgi:hypothetical protein